jgi:hypothetical protein
VATLEFLITYHLCSKRSMIIGNQRSAFSNDTTQKKSRPTIGVPVSHITHKNDCSIRPPSLRARTIVTGISEAVAETIVDLGIDWSGIETLHDLRTGFGQRWSAGAARDSVCWRYTGERTKT